MDGPLDNHFIGHLEQKLEKTRVKRVDADTIDKLIEKEEKHALALSDDQKENVKTVFEKAISKQEMNVTVEALAADELPVTVTMDEFMRRMKDMASMGGGGMMNFYGTLPDNYKVTVNGNHPLIIRLAQLEAEGEKESLAKQAFDLALLSQGMLTGAELTAFVKRSVSML